MSKKHLDTFSGYGGFTLGVNQETIGFSEIELHAVAILKYHYPEIKNYGSITEINADDLPDFDLLTGGSPCQDLSVAGKQKGLSGERSGLFFQFIRLLKEKQPANFIWENVKGTLSSSDGWDFARVQIEMAEAGYAFQWQILNAKYFGVPQSRERVFVVGHLGGECVREVFFETAATTNDIEVVGSLNSETWEKRHESTRRVYSPNGVAPTIPTGTGGGVMCKVFIDLSTKDSKITQHSRALQARYAKGYFHHSGEVSGILAVPLKYLDRNQKNYQGEYSFTVDTVNSGGVMQNYRIRRFTPKECERLMGLTDDWTRYGIKPDGTQYELSDSARYKLCGNGVVVNVVREINKRLEE